MKKRTPPAPAVPAAAAEALFATALSSGLTVREAAGVAGFSERTAYRRLGDTGIRRELALKRAEVCQEAAARLNVAALKAARTVEQLMDHKCPKVRLAAARTAVALARELGDEANRQAVLAANLARCAPAVSLDVDALEVTLANGEKVAAALERGRLTVEQLRAADDDADALLAEVAATRAEVDEFIRHAGQE